MDPDERMRRRRRAVLLQRADARSRVCQAAAAWIPQTAAMPVPDSAHPIEWRDELLRRRLRSPNFLADAAGSIASGRRSGECRPTTLATCRPLLLWAAGSRASCAPNGDSRSSRLQRLHQAADERQGRALAVEAQPVKSYWPLPQLLHRRPHDFQQLLSLETTNECAAMHLQACLRRLFATRGEFSSTLRAIASTLALAAADQHCAVIILQKLARSTAARLDLQSRRQIRDEILAVMCIQHAFHCKHARATLSSLRQAEDRRIKSRQQRGTPGRDVCDGLDGNMEEVRGGGCLGGKDDERVRHVRVGRQTVLFLQEKQENQDLGHNILTGRAPCSFARYL